MEKLLRIGVITTTHGLRGEVKVYPTTDDVSRFDACDEVILVTPKEKIPLHIERVKYFKNLVIVKFKEFDDISQVETFRKCDIMVTRENAVPLEEGEFFICDVIGAEVVEEDGTPVGTVSDVMETGANDVFVIQTADGKEVLFPSIPECIRSVDVETQKIVAHIMPGLIE